MANFQMPLFFDTKYVSCEYLHLKRTENRRCHASLRKVKQDEKKMSSNDISRFRDSSASVAIFRLILPFIIPQTWCEI